VAISNRTCVKRIKKIAVAVVAVRIMPAAAAADFTITITSFTQQLP
jgi:hypothetical protein